MNEVNNPEQKTKTPDAPEVKPTPEQLKQQAKKEQEATDNLDNNDYFNDPVAKNDAPAASDPEQCTRTPEGKPKTEQFKPQEDKDQRVASNLDGNNYFNEDSSEKKDAEALGIKEISFEHPVVQEILNETSMESIRNNPEMESCEQKLYAAVEAHESGITKEEFQELIKTPTGDLSDKDIRTIAEINDAIEMPTNETLMSKAISPEKYQNYIENGLYSDTIGGCLSIAQDMQDCYSFDDYYNKLGLNYKGNDFDHSDKMYVVRFTSSDTENLLVRAYGGSSEADVEKVQNSLGLDSSNTFMADQPFQGAGYTLNAIGEDGKMEFRPTLGENGKDKYCRLENGAAIYEVERSSNEEKLVAVRQANQWLKVRYDNEDE